MELNQLTAISPIDGRYRGKTERLANYFSEFALIRYRVWVEVEYFIAMSEAGLPALSDIGPIYHERLRSIYRQFSLESGARIKEIERTTNHDVKAVEYFLKEQLDQISPEMTSAKEFIHFGLTSQDINNTATPMLIRDAIQEMMVPGYEALLAQIEDLAQQWEGVPMLARTHGQPASPTLVSKEMRVFKNRIQKQLDRLKSLPIPA